MSVSPKNRGVVPPGGFCRYRDPDTNLLIQHPYYDRLKGLALAHRRDKGLTIPHNWDEWFDERFCDSTPAACDDVPNAPDETDTGWLGLASRFTGAMVRWAREGFPVVDYDTFKDRHRICAGDETTPRCPEFRSWRAFGLGRCGKCGCASVKLKLATEKCPLGKW